MELTNIKVTALADKVAEELRGRGYNAEACEVTKNGVKLQGVRIATEGSNIAPVIYLDDKAESLEAEVERIAEIYEENKNPDLDTSLFTDPYQAAQGLRIGLQRSSNEDLVKTEHDLEGIEAYLYIKHGSFSAKVKPELLETIELTEAEAWEIAETNTAAEATFDTMTNYIQQITGADIERPGEMYILTNQDKTRGAAALYSTETLEAIAEAAGTREFIAIPSSIHEWLLIPARSITKEEATQMVQEVNATQVAPEEQLADRAFLIEV